MMAYNVGEIRNSVASKVKANNQVFQLISRESWKKSSLVYQAQFPFSELLRDAAAHGELATKEPEKFQAPVGTDMSIIGSYLNDRFTYTFKGKMISLPMSYEKVASLKTVVASFFDGLARISDEPAGFSFGPEVS